MKPAPILALVLLLAGLSPVPAAETEGDPAKGAADFTKLCARCHRTAASIAKDLSADQPQTITALNDFLATHHTTDATMRADLIAFLLAR